MSDRLEILTIEQMYAADRAAAAAGVESYALMRAAGEAVARAVSSRWSKRRVTVLCGPGLNGGDGYVAARVLTADGWDVRVLALALPTEGDAFKAFEDWGGSPALGARNLDDGELVIDAMFGAGLARPLPPIAEDLLRDAEARGLPIVAIDLPSGLPGDAAEPLGYAPHAALTVTFHRKKPAHVLSPARDLCGEIVVADIGIPAAVTAAPTLWENHPDLWLAHYPSPMGASDKHARGALGGIGGRRFQTRAERLAARAGLRVAGLVRVFCEPAAADIYAAALEATMLKPFRSIQELGDLAMEMDAFVIGPAAGVTDATRDKLIALAGSGVPMVIDADALTVLKDEPATLFALVEDSDVITPHPGEFERIFPGLLGSSATRIDAAREAANLAGCIVLLKGADTVIAAPDGRAAVNTHATPWLATAGSGDVLAGIIGGLMAGGMPTFEAACAGVWMHGDAGLRFGPGLTAEDLPQGLPTVITGLTG